MTESDYLFHALDFVLDADQVFRDMSPMSQASIDAQEATAVARRAIQLAIKVAKEPTPSNPPQPSGPHPADAPCNAELTPTD